VYRLQPRPTLPHHGIGRHFDGQTRLQRSHPSQVGRIRALLGLTHDDLVDLRRLHLSPLHGLRDNDLGQILRLDVLEPATQPAYRCTHRTDDDYFFHETLFRLFAAT